MAVWLTQASRAGTIPADKPNVQGGQSQLSRYDATVTSKTVAIGGAAIELDETTTHITIGGDASTSFRWALVATSGASLPANSPVCMLGQRATWDLEDDGPRFFKTSSV